MTDALARIRLDMLWHRLVAVVEEQAQVLLRTAFSPVVREAGDLSCGVFDTQGRMLAQAVTGTPGHVNTMARAVGHVLARIPLSRMAPGEQYGTNDPWLGSGHLHDITVVAPVFCGAVPVALVACVIHLTDIGGRGQGPDAASVFEEGIRIPITRIATAARIEPLLLDILRANVRTPEELEGDLNSCLAANMVGARRVLGMMAEQRLESLAALSDHILAVSRRATEAAVAAWPAGRFEAAMRIDGFGAPITLRCAATIGAGRVALDFAGSSPAIPRGINVPLAYTAAYAGFALRCAIAPEVPNNAGSLAPVAVSAPEGCILNAPSPWPVSARHVTGLFIPDLVFAALDQARPGTLPAAGAGCLWTVQLRGGPTVQDAEGRAGTRSFDLNVSHAGGMGGRPGRAGLAATGFPSGARAIATEIVETRAPVVVWRKELREGSGGAGRHRGGDGQVVEIASKDGSPMALIAMFERVATPPPGSSGGSDGAAGEVALEDGTPLAAKGLQVIPAGRRLRLALPGGGGWGAA